ncbi:TonB C-terminal domain-containing protein, partial [Dissulfurirhabdus thermomarina]
PPPRPAPAPRVPEAEKAVSLRPRPAPREDNATRLSREALARLEARLRALEEEKKREAAERRLERRLAELAAAARSGQGAPAAGTDRAGNGTAAGGGRLGTALEVVLQRYADEEVYPRVRRNWAVPVELSKERGLECVMVIRISAEGRVVKAWMEKSSGARFFDRAARLAVTAAGELPPLPAPLRPGPVEIGIRFGPEGVGR